MNQSVFREHFGRVVQRNGCIYMKEGYERRAHLGGWREGGRVVIPANDLTIPRVRSFFFSILQ